MTRTSRLGTRWLVGAGLGTPLLVLLGWWSVECAVCRPDETLSIPAVIGSKKRTIRVDRFSAARFPDAAPRSSAVVLLHGIEGAARNQRSRFRQARLLSRQGHHVFVVRYFDSVEYEDLWRFTADGRIDLAAIEDHCRRDAGHWTNAVGQVLQAISARADVDSQRIALNGYSLGGFIALATAEAALADEGVPNVRAVVVNWGARFADTDFSADFPAVLLIHGKNDDVVPLASAETTADALKAVGVNAQLFVIPGAGHAARSLEADEATFDFLRDQLAAPDEAGLVELTGRGALSSYWPHDPQFLAPGMPRF